VASNKAIKTLSEYQKAFQSAGGFSLHLVNPWFEMVARDGIEPPTPAFSGLPSNYGKRFEMKANGCCKRG